MKVLLETVSGSDLYGLATPTSDHDVYRVVERMPIVYSIRPKKYAKQSLRGLDDVLTVDLSTWLLMCAKGTPQALEVMWSRQATIDTLTEFRMSYRAHYNVIPTYLRTIEGLCYKGEHDRKFRRHAVRLALNANSIIRIGWFDPTMTSSQIDFIREVAEFSTDRAGKSDSAALSEHLNAVVFK